MNPGELKKILYVEDDPGIQFVTGLILEDEGFDVQICSSGAEAMLKGPLFRPDLILLDVMMPDMDGPATLAAMRRREELASVPVIFMTAKAQTHEVPRYMELGAKGVLVKPFDPMTLCDQIRAIWGECHA